MIPFFCKKVKPVKCPDGLGYESASFCKEETKSVFVIVPVLSKHIVSTLANVSIQYNKTKDQESTKNNKK